MHKLRFLFLSNILITIISSTVTGIAWSIFLINSGAGIKGATQLWLDYGYWCWILLAMLVFFKNPWGVLPLALTTPNNISFFYRFFFTSTFLYRDWSWYCDLIAAVSAFLMLIFGFIYYVTYFWPNREVGGH